MSARLAAGAERLGHLVLVAGSAALCAVHVPLWVSDGGPSRASWTRGAQVLPLTPAQGGFVELVLDEPADHPFASQ